MTNGNKDSQQKQQQSVLSAFLMIMNYGARAEEAGLDTDCYIGMCICICQAKKKKENSGSSRRSSS